MSKASTTYTIVAGLFAIVAIFAITRGEMLSGVLLFVAAILLGVTAHRERNREDA